MNTIELNPIVELVKEGTIENARPADNRLTRFIDSQEKNRTGWFMTSLLWQGVLCLPVPAFLIFYYDAPIWTLMITVSLFFINLIAGMGGSKIRVVLGLLAAGTLIHLLMILAFVL